MIRNINPTDGAPWWSFKNLIFIDPIPGTGQYSVQVNNQIDRTVTMLDSTADSPRKGILKALMPTRD